MVCVARGIYVCVLSGSCAASHRESRLVEVAVEDQQVKDTCRSVCAIAADAVSRDSGDIARRSGGAMTTRGEWARSRRCCSGIARNAP